MASSATLPEKFAGELIRPQDARYDEARSLFNGLIDKHPALIARCADSRDVQSALLHARENDLVVAVRGGGHSSPGYSSCDDGVVIDVSPMKEVAIDAAGRSGRFGAGLTWGELDAATAEHGLAVTGGRVTHTGVAGLALGSGSGWLERLLGPSAANLLSAEVVTADGRLLRASANENPDLLWGLKGGGGNFGVVTEFEFRLHPVGPIVFGGVILHPLAAAGDLLRFYRDFMDSAPDEVGGGFAFATTPPDEHLPEHVRGVPVAMLIVMHAGDPVEGERALRPLLDWGDPLLAMVQPMPYTAVQALIDDSSPWGIKDYFKVDYLPELADDAIDAACEHAAQRTSPQTVVVFSPLGGAMDRIDKATMALEIPQAKWNYFCLAMWTDAALTQSEIAWSREFAEVMRPWCVGKAPPNFIDDGDHARLRASFGDDKFRRLVELKAKYDPDNVFTLNQNIPTAVPV
jgi:FAD/FMN-containing dehydrogenase